LPVFRDAIHRTDDLNPAGVHSRVHTIELVKRVLAIFLFPERPRQRIERHAKAVADAIREDALNVRADLSANDRTDLEKRVVDLGAQACAWWLCKECSVTLAFRDRLPSTLPARARL
jgi:hypothetical protein